MTRRLVMVGMGMVLLSGIAAVADAAEPKPIHTQKTKEAVITLANEAGQLKVGKNTFTLTFADPATGKPLDVGTVAFETSMAMPGMAPMLAGGTVTRDATPGRYLATITFPDAGARQVTLRWDGPAGKGTARFSVSVR
jgi:YtkA-like